MEGNLAPPPSTSEPPTAPTGSGPRKCSGNGQSRTTTFSPMNRAANDLYDRERDQCLRSFSQWTQADQIDFVQHILHQMCHYQHGLIDTFLKPMLQRDFLSLLPKSYLDHIAEKILSYLDARSLAACEAVCREWRRVISEGMLWKKLIERQVRTDLLWKGLSERRGWNHFLFKCKPLSLHTVYNSGNNNNHISPSSKMLHHYLTNFSSNPLHDTYKPWGGGGDTNNSGPCFSSFFSQAAGLTDPAGAFGSFFNQSASSVAAILNNPTLPDHSFYHRLYPTILKDISNLESNWRLGKHALRRIRCRSENSKGVYCLQYDDHKIVSGLRDNTIKIWDFKTLECIQILTGHTGSVLCLQYDDRIIVTGSSDATVRIWDVNTGEMLNTLIHHCEAVLHLRFEDGVMVTCSKDRSIAVWDMQSPSDITLRRVLVGHRAAVNVVDFDQKYIVSASGDRTIKVWDTSTCEFVRTLNGHKRGIACLQYRERLIVSGSSDYTIRLWDIECGACLRILEGHEELVRCIRFDNKRIVSGAYDGKIKVWDLAAALDPRTPAGSVCVRTLVEHTGRVFRLQFDEFQIVSSSHDDTILIWDFLNYECPAEPLGGLQTGPDDDSNNANDIDGGMEDRPGPEILPDGLGGSSQDPMGLVNTHGSVVIENAMMIDGSGINAHSSMSQTLRANNSTTNNSSIMMAMAMEESQDNPSTPFNPPLHSNATSTPSYNAMIRVNPNSIASYANGFTRASLTTNMEVPYQPPQTNIAGGGTSCATYNTNFFRQASQSQTSSTPSAVSGHSQLTLTPSPTAVSRNLVNNNNNIAAAFDMFRRSTSAVVGQQATLIPPLQRFVPDDDLAEDTNDAALDQEILDEAAFTNEEGSSPG